MSFDGFDPGAVALLGELPSYDAERFQAAKGALRAGLLQPGAALIEEVAEGLGEPLTVARNSVSPLHTDRRFAPPGAPRYKDHLLLTTWHGPVKASAPTLWIRVDSQRVGFAAGMGFGGAARERWRSSVGGDAGEDMARLLKVLVDDSGAEVVGEQAKKVPPPFAQDHPRADLLRRNAIQVRTIESLPTSLGDAGFVDWCADRLRSLLPVHRWLVDNVG